MLKKMAVLSVFSLVFNTNAYSQGYPITSQPLTKQQLLALVAGESLPENIVAEIRTLGLGFSPDPAYVALLKTASAPPVVLNALTNAQSHPSSAGTSGNAVALQHMSQAGDALSKNQLDVTTKELNQALSAGADKSCVGFIGGLVLMQQNQWQEAGEVYGEILREDPDFPQLHTRLSATSYHTGNYPQMLREAKAALRQIPTDPAAHLNAALALTFMRNEDAAKLEFQASIENKPDYVPAYGGLAYLLEDKGDHDGAIAQYKKALALQPGDTHDRYGLGVSYMHKEDWPSAIREFRIVKSQNPQDLEARQNLGACLLHIDPPAAVTEFSELVAISPSYNVCHDCLGSALAQSRRYPEAEKEFAMAIENDPAAANPHLNLGIALESEQKYDQALIELRKAEKLDPENPKAFVSAGWLFLTKKEYPAAIEELKRAEQLAPEDWQSHDLRGQALRDSGNIDDAAAEFNEAVSLGPKEVPARLDLAGAQEKKGDWVSALDNYRKAADQELLLRPAPIHKIQVMYDADAKYKAALGRYKQHLADLRASGNGSQAADLESRVSTARSSSDSTDQFQALMQDGVRAMKDRRWSDAESSLKQARDIGEKNHVKDARLPEVYGHLGSIYFIRGDYQDAEPLYRRQLALYEQLYRPDSPMILPALEQLGTLFQVQKRLPAAHDTFARAVAISTASYGENSSDSERSLTNLSRLLMVEQDFQNAEIDAQRVVKIAETMYGPDDFRMAPAVSLLCNVYDMTRDAAKDEPCHQRMISLEEKEYGANSPRLAMDLNTDAYLLRKLGRNDEAANVEARAKALQSASAQQPH
jgi:tetratricopeptide (TPR) repeat protein